MSLDLTGYDNEQALREGEYNPPDPGIYHLAISAVDTQPASKSGEALDGLQVSFQVLTGTVEGQEGKEFRQLFFYPSPSAKDGGKFAAKRLAMLGLATEVISRDQLGKSVDPNWDDMAARHFVAAVKEGSDPKYREIDGLKMWHVNHPDAAKYPKDAEVMEAMPMEWQPEAPPAGGEKAAPAASTKAPASASAPAKTAPKPDTARSAAGKSTAGNGNGNGGAGGANGGAVDRSAAAAAAVEGGPATAKKADAYSILDD